MKLPLQAKVSLFVTLLIVLISAVSTFLFTSAHSRSREKGHILRGSALSYALSKAAEEGLSKEDLNLLNKASEIVQSPDVTLAQVYSNIWEPVDAYPFDRLRQPPHPDAVEHFKSDSAPLQVALSDGYDFYSPVFFKAPPESPPVTIGFVRLTLSSAGIKKELREIVVTNTAASAIITLFAVISINILIARFVIRPVMALHRSVSAFKDGLPPVPAALPRFAAGELTDLAAEFNALCLSIRDKEERLIESDRKIRSLFERVKHGIFRLDRNGNLVEANSRFRDLFGDTAGLCDVIIRDNSAPDCLNKAALENALHLEEKAITKTGEEIMVSLSLYPEHDNAGAVTGFDGYIIDITEKKRLEERLMRAQKLEAIGTLAGGIAHDFNNVLAGVLGYAEIITKQTKEDDPLHRYATIIRQAAQRGADLSKKILSVTRKEKIETRPVDLNEVIASSTELFHRSMPKNIEIALDLRKDLPMIKADPSQIQQVVMNLAVNARDAMPEGGRLTIETSVVGSENGAAGALPVDRSGFLKLSVSDTGSGMDTATQRRVFDPFFTTKESGKGTGLGLYIVHSVVSNHSGYINLYSEPGKGTRINVYLPYTGGVAPETAAEPEDLRGSGTVLVIDDEAHVRELCKDMLEPLGYTVLLAPGGEEGVGMFRVHRDGISLVLLDIIMPKMGGSEVFQALKMIRSDVKVLLCSGYSHSGFAGIETLLKNGALGLVQKPFSLQAMAGAVKRALTEGRA